MGYPRIDFKMWGRFAAPPMVNAVNTTKHTANRGWLAASWFSGVNTRCVLGSMLSRFVKVGMMFFQPCAQWPTAPKVVVYDFACQLAPYCLMREPNFFRNTRFRMVPELQRSLLLTTSLCHL